MEMLLRKIENSPIYRWMEQRDIHFNDLMGELPADFDDFMSALVITMEQDVDRYTAFDGRSGGIAGDDAMLLGYFASNLFRDYNVNDQFLQKRMIEVVIGIHNDWKQAKSG